MADVNYGSTKEGLFQSALDFLKQKKSLPSKLYRELEEETGQGPLLYPVIPRWKSWNSSCRSWRQELSRGRQKKSSARK